MIKIKSITFTFSILLLLAQNVIATEESDFPGIRNLMSDEVFKKSGLQRLTDRELRNLNEWLTNYTAIDAEAVKSRSATVRKVADTKEFRATIQGEFKGWSGKTIFTLDNGQVWQQRLRGRYFIRTTNPEVIISKNAMGYYRLEVAETGKRVGVKRLK